MCKNTAAKAARAGLLTWVALGGLLVLASPAHAQAVVELGPISATILQAIGRLVSSVRLAVVNTQQQVTDASNTTNADFHVSLTEQAILRNHAVTPATCAAVDGAQALSVGAQQTQVVSTGVGGLLNQRGEAEPTTNGYYGGAQSAQAGTGDHNRLYCSALDAANGVCNAVDSIWQNRDQRANSLFGVPTYTPDDATAAQAYVVNLVQPAVPPAPRTSAANSVAGAALVASRRQYNASISLANYVGGDILASHAQTVTTLGPDLQRQEQLEGRPTTATASWFDTMDLEVNRHSSLTYQNALESMSNATVVARENARLAVLQSTILWALYKRMDQLAAVDSASLAYLASQHYSQAMHDSSTMAMSQTTTATVGN